MSSTPESVIPEKNALGSFAAARVVALLISAVLLVATALKFHQLVTEPLSEQGILSSRWFMILLVECELFLGLWLLSGVFSRLAWLVTVACFGVFCGVSFYKGVTGEASCGCFGKLTVNPWITLVLDLVLLAASLAFRPGHRNSAKQPRTNLRLAMVLILAMALGIPAAVKMASYRPASLSDDGVIVGDPQVVVLEPQKWLNKPLPLLKHIDQGSVQQLRSGRWTLLLYRHDCPDCRTKMQDLSAVAKAFAGEGTGIATIELPPYGTSKDAGAAGNAHCIQARLSDERDWFVTTPTLIAIADGIVTKVQEGQGASQAQVVNSTSAPTAQTALTTYDFGYVEPGSIHSVAFTIRNSAGKSLAIASVKSDCSCLTVSSPPKAIPAKGAIKVQMDLVAPKENSFYSHRVVLTPLDSKNPPIILTVKASIGMPLEVKSGGVAMGRLVPGEVTKGKLTLVNHSEEPVQPLYATSSVTGVVARVPRATIAAHSSLTIPVEVDADQVPGDAKAVSLTIFTSCAVQPQVSAEVSFTQPK